MFTTVCFIKGLATQVNYFTQYFLSFFLPLANLGHTFTWFKIRRISCFQNVRYRKLSFIKSNSINFFLFFKFFLVNQL